MLSPVTQSYKESHPVEKVHMLCVSSAKNKDPLSELPPVRFISETKLLDDPFHDDPFPIYYLAALLLDSRSGAKHPILFWVDHEIHQKLSDDESFWVRVCKHI